MGKTPRKESEKMIKYTGIDWLTLTTDGDGTGYGWYEIYNSYKREKLLEELEEKPFNNGYYAGVGIGGMRWGYSEKLGYILVCSGILAHQMYGRLAPLPKRVTRLDLAVDILLTQPQDLAKKSYGILSQRPPNAKPQVALYEGSTGGITLYVGSRQSTQFGRLYDKGIESGLHPPRYYWRYEVEYKKPIAQAVEEKFIDLKPNERHEMIIAGVGKWFRDRKVITLFEDDTGRELDISVAKRVSTVSRKLTWLRTQVAPTVHKLVDAGHGCEVLRSLLLDERAIEDIFRAKFARDELVEVEYQQF